MHTLLFYLPYNIITFCSIVVAYTDNADRTETAFEEEDSLSKQVTDFYGQVSKVKPLASFASNPRPPMQLIH